MRLCTSRVAATLAAATALVAVLALPAFADVTIQLNGNTASFSPGPIERAGRIFVPLRGVFEKLGASVVYEAGIINATGNNRNVSLKIGSNSATVNGQGQYLDVAPFIIGASTYVPLRFVSQALGATVNYDASNRIVAITQNGAPPAAAPAATARVSGVQLSSLHPGKDTSTNVQSPTIRAAFTEGVDPNSLRIWLDGRDVTTQTTVSESGVIYKPPSPLDTTRHVVRITGKDQQGLNFDRSWAFTTGTQAAIYLNIVQPSNGSSVGTSFTLKGHTLAGAHVHIEAGGTAGIGPLVVGTGNYRGDVTADSAGNFTQPVSLTGVSGGSIGLVVTATDPATNTAAERQLTLHII